MDGKAAGVRDVNIPIKVDERSFTDTAAPNKCLQMDRISVGISSANQATKSMIRAGIVMNGGRSAVVVGDYGQRRRRSLDGYQQLEQ